MNQFDLLTLANLLFTIRIMEVGNVETIEASPKSPLAQVRSILEQHAAKISQPADDAPLTAGQSEWDQAAAGAAEAAKRNRQEEAARCQELIETLNKFSQFVEAARLYPEAAAAINSLNGVTLPGVSMLREHAERIAAALGADSSAFFTGKTKADIKIPFTINTSIAGVLLQVETRYSGPAAVAEVNPDHIYPTLRLVVPLAGPGSS